MRKANSGQQTANSRDDYFRPRLAGEKRWSSPKGRRAYIALVGFLIVSAVVLLIGITLAMLGVSEAQMGLSEKRGRYALALAEGCAEDALLSAYYGDILVDQLVFDRDYLEDSCTVTVEGAGDDWTITATATASGHTKRVEVTIDRGGEISIISWKEIE